SVDGTSEDAHRVATYSVTPPGGVWTETANGTYTISIEPDAARNLDGNPVPPGPIGTFTVDVTAEGPPAAAKPKAFYAVGVDAYVTPELRVLTTGPQPGARPVPTDVFNRAQVRVYDSTGALQGEFNAYPYRGIGGV